MRSHWETSEKSIYVRTVWLNGVRHAILSKNDPLVNSAGAKRPYSCGNIAKWNKKRSGQEYRLSISTSTSSSNLSSHIDTNESSDIEYEHRFGYQDEDMERSCERDNQSNKKIRLPNLNSNYSANNNFSANNGTSYSTSSVNNNSSFTNPITERVLNWLDLANKETIHYVYTPTVSNELSRQSSEDSRTHYGNSNETNRTFDRSGDERFAPGFGLNKNENKRDRPYYENNNTKLERNIKYIPYSSKRTSERNRYSDKETTENNDTNHANKYEVLSSETNGKRNNKHSEDPYRLTYTNSIVQLGNTNAELSKNIRNNNETIRKNNDNINKLIQNIQHFKHTNEISDALGNTKFEHSKCRSKSGKKLNRKSKTSTGRTRVHLDEECNGSDDEDNESVRYVIMRNDAECGGANEYGLGRRSSGYGSNGAKYYEDTPPIYQQTSRPNTSKPQLHIFMPRFKNIS